VTVTPSWLYDFFGALMLGVAAYSVALLVVTLAAHRSSGWDVDVAHILMGVSMAGMFIVSWAFGPKSLWEFTFIVLLAWFLVRSAQSIRRYGIHLPHYLIHAVMSLAMFLMFAFVGPATGASMRSMSMSMPMSTSPRLDPGVAFLVALSLLSLAIFTVGSAKRGTSHHGSHVPALTKDLGPPVPGGDSAGAGGQSALLIETLVTTPWVEDASTVAMCVAMGFLLILMI
jgi:hypothetical protein